MFVYVFSSHLFLTSSSLEVPAGVTQEEGHTGFLIHLPSPVHAFIFLARRIQPFLSVELTHLVVKWSAVRNQAEIETSLKMRGMSPFLFVKLIQQRRTQNHAKPAHRVRRSSGQPFTGTTRSAGVGGFGLALAILVGLAKKWCCAAFLYISCRPFFTT